jgi:hypothetical protein
MSSVTVQHVGSIWRYASWADRTSTSSRAPSCKAASTKSKTVNQATSWQTKVVGPCPIEGASLVLSPLAVRGSGPRNATTHEPATTVTSSKEQ